jgi:hypothetical protein
MWSSMLLAEVLVVEMSVAMLLMILPCVVWRAFGHRHQVCCHVFEVRKIEGEASLGSPIGQAFGGFPTSGVSKPGAVTLIWDLTCTDEERLENLALILARLGRELTRRLP